MHTYFFLSILLAVLTVQLSYASPFPSIKPRWLPDIKGDGTAPSTTLISSDPPIGRAQRLSIKIRDAVTTRIPQELRKHRFPEEYARSIYAETVRFLNSVRPGQILLPTEPDTESPNEGLRILLEHVQKDAGQLVTAIADSVAQMTAQYALSTLTLGKGGEFDPTWSDPTPGSPPNSDGNRLPGPIVDAMVLGLGLPLKIRLNGLLQGLSKTWYFHLYDLFLSEQCPATRSAGPFTCEELRKALLNRRDALGDRLQPAVQKLLHKHWSHVTDTTVEAARAVMREYTK